MKRYGLLLPLFLLGSLVLSACEVDEYCLDCKRDGSADDDGGGDDDGDGGSKIDGGGPPPDACTPNLDHEVCDGLDNDCNGQVDDDPAGAGETCGAGLPAPCTQGVTECVNGDLVCGGGAVTPKQETCNNVDDDCDGTVDDGNPEGGTLCGVAKGDCKQGLLTCVNGGLSCVGEVKPTAELCDNRDNDCDGMIDDGDPEGGATCGMQMGQCVPGVEHCVGGVVVCQGGSGPTLEKCDTLDNDCDGSADEDFNLMTDRNNCGMCGNKCTATDAVTQCATGQCKIAFCTSGHFDLDKVYANGCEYACNFNGAEVCNGVDDDCDGMIDEGVVVPTGLCASFGECAGATATCMGAAGFVCNYPATVSTDGMGNIVPETNCDGKDNDCDTQVDEAFPTKNQACLESGKQGICQGTGSFMCNAAKTGVECVITMPGQASTTELCNGKDDDCDGMVDEVAQAKDSWQAISGGGVSGTKYIMRYEASRPDAKANSQGTSSARACSNPGVLPWTDVTYPEAEAACAAAGGRLCSETEWQRACNTSAGTACKWSYDSSCGTYSANKCNGNDFDFDGNAGNGDQDGLLATANRAMCYASWGAAPAQIFDLSGNAKEWTQTASGDPANTRRLRGGSYNNTADGIQCDFRFAVADNTFKFPNVGFRCCRDSAPP